VVYYEIIIKYLWKSTSNGADVISMQNDILDMFETGVQEGKDVFVIVGNDVIGFCDVLLYEIPKHTWIGKMKSKINQNIQKVR